MELEEAERAALIAGIVTVPAGIAMLASPKVGGSVGLKAGESRVIGVMDLSIAPGLLAARPRWPWAVARAAANVPTALALARTGTPLGRVLAAALTALIVVDGRAAATLKAAGR